MDWRTFCHLVSVCGATSNATVSLHSIWINWEKQTEPSQQFNATCYILLFREQSLFVKIMHLWFCAWFAFICSTNCVVAAWLANSISLQIQNLVGTSLWSQIRLLWRQTMFFKMHKCDVLAWLSVYTFQCFCKILVWADNDSSGSDTARSSCAEKVALHLIPVWHVVVCSCIFAYMQLYTTTCQTS